MSATVRTEGPLDVQALWAIVNQLLAERGLATVRPPGSEAISVVKVADAPALARIERDAGGKEPLQAGFQSRVVELRSRPSKETLDAIRLALGKGVGTLSQLGEGRRVLVSDLAPRVEQALWVIEQMDQAEDQVAIERVRTRLASAQQVAAAVAGALEAFRASGGAATRASVRVAATGDDSWLLVVGPAGELAMVLELIDAFDRAPEVVVAVYAGGGLDLAFVASHIEAVARDAGPRGSGDRWKVIEEVPTGTLVVTATPSEHQQIRAAMDRLAALPPEARVPVRTYAIRNRSVEEVVAILQDLVASGVLSAETSFEAGAPFDASAAAQRTTRDVLPAGARSVLGPDAPSPTGAASGDRRGAVRPPAASASAAGAVRQPGSLSITADPATNILIASGEPRLLAQLESLLKTLDVRQPQVMLEVLVLSLSDTDTLDLGVEIEALIRSGDTFVRLASLFGLGPLPLLPPVGGAIPAATGQGGTALVLRPGDYGVLVRALETMNDGRALNIPKVLVNNNEQGTLDSTLQVPYSSTNASTTVATTSFGGTEDAGTTVTIRPQIAAGDHMRLEYAVSLSSFVGAASDPSLPPPKQQNSLQSVVTIPDGHTVALGGLEIRTEGEAITQVPFIGDVPGVGELFRKRSRTATRTRFFVFITPQVLRREGFDDLRHIGAVELREAGLEDRFPVVEAQIVR